MYVYVSVTYVRVLPAAWASFSIPPPFWWWRQWSLSLMANDIKLWSAFMSSHVNWMLGLVKVVIVSKVNDSGCCERVRPALKVPLDGKYINPLETPPAHTYSHNSHTQIRFNSLSFPQTPFLFFVSLSFFQCKWFIVSFYLTYASLKWILGRHGWPIRGSCWFIQMKWLLSEWPQVGDWKGNCRDFFLMRLFVLGTNILLCL